jgi:hypothetical protein
MKIQQFFQDGSGQLSATRLAFLLWAVGTLIVSAYTAIAGPAGSAFKVDPSVITLMGILMTGKVVQTFSPGDQAPPIVQPATAGSTTAQPQVTITPATLAQALKEMGAPVPAANVGPQGG